MKTLLTIAVIVTSVILVLSLVIGVIAMAYSGVFENISDTVKGWFDKDQGGDEPYDDGGNERPSSPDEDDNGLKIPYTLQLPVQSASKNYVSTNASNMQSISGITSEAAILVKMNGNVAIAGKNADTRVHPASMAKLMTLIVACENMTTMNALLTVEQSMVDYMVAEGGSGIGLQVGQQVSVEDALYLISYNSDTIACLMIAKHIAGSEAEFVKLMNKKASDLHLNGTHFSNSTGLYDDVTNGSGGVANDYTYTTCRDMAAIMNCAMNNSAVKSIITSTSKDIPLYTNNEPLLEKNENGAMVHKKLNAYTRWFSNENRFNNNSSITSSLRVISGKTGGEDIPSSCFVTTAKDNSSGEMYICVVIGRMNNNISYVNEKTSTNDTRLIYKNYIS